MWVMSGQCRVGVLCFARYRLLMWGRSVVSLDVGKKKLLCKGAGSLIRYGTIVMLQVRVITSITCRSIYN